MLMLEWEDIFHAFNKTIKIEWSFYAKVGMGRCMDHTFNTVINPYNS